MLKRSHLVCSAFLLLVGIAACDSSTGPSSGLSKADANQLAADMDAVSTLGTADFGFGTSFSVGADGSGSSASLSAAPFTFENSFSVTRQCPKGGQVVIAGTVAGEGDRATRSLTVDTEATRTDANCAFQTRNGILTLNGNPDIDYTAHLNIVNGALSGLQTQTHNGSFTWSRDGGPVTTCDVDLVSEFDPATHTATVKGTFCGHDVDVTRTRGSR